MNIKQDFLPVNKFSRPGTKLQQVTKVAVHYTGDPGATAQNEHDYFAGLSKSGARYVSCHYVVGLNGEIIQCIPETEWSYCTNAANGYSISIETCHPDATGKFNAASEQSLIDLVADICKRHGLNPQEDVIRHFDVTGKQCPLWYVTHPQAWQLFKQRVQAELEPNSYAVTVGKFGQQTKANEISGYLTAIGFYNEVKPSDGQLVINVFSFAQKERAEALAALLKQNLYSYVTTV